MIARLLLHFWTPQELSDESRRAMAEDWVGDLAGFDPDTVSRACGEWRIAQSKRPTIADIRRLCIEDEAMRAEQNRPAAPSPYASPAYREERNEKMDQRDRSMQLEGRAIVNNWAREQGFADLDAYAQAQGIHWSEAYRKYIREFLAESPMQRAVDASLVEAQRSLGVTAREYTSSELSQARTELGMEE